MAVCRSSAVRACRSINRALVHTGKQFSTTASVREQLHDADESAFKSHISNTKDKVILVDFYEDWCAPCKMLSPLLERIEKDPSIIGAKALDLVTVRGEDAPTLATQFEIRAVPTVFAFKNGSVLGQFVGAMGLPEIKKWYSTLKT